MTKLQYDGCLFTVGFCLMMAGCSGKTVTVLSGTRASEVEAMFQTAESCVTSGEVDRAIMILDRGLARCTETEQKERAHSMIMRVLTDAGQYDAVQQRYLVLAERDRSMAARLLDQVEGGLKSRRRYAEIVKIGRRLAESEGADVKLVRLFVMQIEALRADGRFYAVLDLIPVCVAEVSYDGAQEVIAGLFDSLVREDQYEDLNRLIGFIGERFSDNEGFKELCIVAGIERLIRTSFLEQAENVVIENASDLSDVNLAGVVAEILKRAQSLEKMDVVDRMCSFVVKRAGGKRRTISAAVGPWIDMAIKKEDWATVTRRISLFMELDASPSALYQAYSRVCHDVIRADDRENLKELVRAGVKLSGLLVDPVQVSILTRLVVDCCFVVEEYDVALRMLAGSSSGLDAEEADIMRNKLLAHKALKDGNKQLAVALFRSFMESVRRMDEDLVDPVAWETVPKEFVLGLNAARVADILASMGDRKGAVEARGEAKGYYEIALGRLPEGSVRSGEIEKKLKRLR